MQSIQACYNRMEAGQYDQSVTVDNERATLQLSEESRTIQVSRLPIEIVDDERTRYADGLHHSEGRLLSIDGFSDCYGRQDQQSAATDSDQNRFITRYLHQLNRSYAIYPLCYTLSPRIKPDTIFNRVRSFTQISFKHLAGAESFGRFSKSLSCHWDSSYWVHTNRLCSQTRY